MADWNVSVITHDGQLKTVTLYDYNMQSDAERAALAQTGGQRVYCANCFTAKKETPSTSQNSNSNTYHTYDYSNVEFDFSTKDGLIAGYIAAAILPTFLLWCIHPIPAILFNIAFARWWFTN